MLVNDGDMPLSFLLRPARRRRGEPSARSGGMFSLPGWPLVILCLAETLEESFLRESRCETIVEEVNMQSRMGGNRGGRESESCEVGAVCSAIGR